MTIHREIFRAYDIRGIVDETLNTDSVHLIGRALGTEMQMLGSDTAAIGRDGRKSSPDFAEALCEGLISTGCDVIDIGMVPTPTLYHAASRISGGTGFQVTGSHNPSQYNGIKMMINQETLAGERIQDIKNQVLAMNFSDGQGQYSSMDVRSAYIASILEDIQLKKTFKVVIDCGNGIVGSMAPEVFKSMGLEVIELFCEVDGDFPNHHPDPSVPENLEDLINTVRKSGADLGFAFDGDGDRIGVVSATGQIIWPDRQMVLFSNAVLEQNPGAQIIFDVKCSQVLARSIARAGGEPIMWKTGHSFMKEKIKESGAPLAGEMSGHIFFNDRWDGFDDGVYAAARMCELLSEKAESPCQVFAAIPDTVNTPELKISLKEGEPLEIVEALVQSAVFANAKVSLIDGIRVDFEDGFGLVRASNTTPSVIMRFESTSRQALDSIIGRFRTELKKIRPDLDIPY
ncbi:MAG: phosphomannomutase/phosphoglucomutase [Gammaproteobacteria bacterium]|nr:phosphomannomutase/phosphoglucomutase [Gammaproteobacteria bacterium]